MVKVNTRLLRVKMTERGFDTINSLATKTGVNRTTIGWVVNGKSAPSLKVANSICEALDLSAQEAAEIFFAGNLRKT